MKMKNKEDSLTVAVRIRPISHAEVSMGCAEIISAIENNMVCMLDPSDNEYDILRVNRSREKTFVFDHVFGPYSSQGQVYNQTTKALVESVLDGYNATIFAYGPTGAGKTYTMVGTDVEPGIMVLTLNYLYQEMHRTRHDQKYSVKMSYLEIYNEMVRDLLNPTSDFLDVREDTKGVQVAGLTEYEALTTSEIMELLSRGNKERMCEPTAVNETSSRSHAILQVTVEQRSRVRDITDEVKIAKLFMIDLAGSERASQTQNKGKRLIEGAHINRSLLALGNCINALTEKGGKSTYVNYRDSKLTRLLKDSLGGNCKTVMIAHVSPASLSFEESRNTLAYADRAKSIKVKAKRNQYSVNYHVAQYQNIISDLRQEIILLKTQLVEADSINHSSARTVVNRTKSANVMERLKEELKVTFQEQLELRKEIIDLEDTALQYSVEYQRHLLTIEEWEQEESRRRVRETGKMKTTNQIIKENFRAKHASPFRRHEQFVDKNNKNISEPADVTAARDEILTIKQRLEEIEDEKTNLTEKLDEQKREKEYLEESFQNKISNEDRREILEALCKIHDFQIRNVELESVALMREYLLQHKDLTTQRKELRNNVVHDIVELQRDIIQGNNLKYPFDLESLYQMYKEQVKQDNVPMAGLAIDVKRIGTQVPALPPLVTRVDETKLSPNTSPYPGKNNLKVKKKWTDNNFSDQESVTSSKFNLTRNPFPVNSYNDKSSDTLSNNAGRYPRRRGTFVYKDGGSLIYEHSTQSSQTKGSDSKYTTPRLQTLQNSNMYIQPILPKHILSLSRENDTHSTSSIQTVSVKVNNDVTMDDRTERKRSASAELIRGKALIGRKVDSQLTHRRKTKTYNKTSKQTKPLWNSNFSTKVNRSELYATGLEAISNNYGKPMRQNKGLERMTDMKHFPTNSPRQQIMTVKTTVPKQKVVRRNDNSNFVKTSNDNLAISGTSFVPRPSQPGFGRL